MARVLRLPDHGRLLVCTDLQGCLRDFERIVQLFEEALLAHQGDAHVLFTGDLIHGPHIDPEDWPDFLGEYYRDASGEVMIAYAMNGEQLPLLNGFPLRLIVPGWYATYWVKMLSDIEVLAAPDDNFWTKSAYRIPDTPFANVKPGEANVKTVPINRMLPRSFITNLRNGQTIAAGKSTALRGIAFGGDCGVAMIDVSADGGRTWQSASLGTDEGKYSFRQWQADISLAGKGTARLQVRCTNTNGAVQPSAANWNPSGFMRNVIEEIAVTAA